MKILIVRGSVTKILFFDSCLSHYTFPKAHTKHFNIFTAAAFMLSSMLGTFKLGYELSD